MKQKPKKFTPPRSSVRFSECTYQDTTRMASHLKKSVAVLVPAEVYVWLIEQARASDRAVGPTVGAIIERSFKASQRRKLKAAA